MSADVSWFLSWPSTRANDGCVDNSDNEYDISRSICRSGTLFVRCINLREASSEAWCTHVGGAPLALGMPVVIGQTGMLQ